MAVLDEFTLTAGSTGGFGFSLFGFRAASVSNPIGTINGSTSAYSTWLGSVSLTTLSRESYSGFTGILLSLIAPGDPGNSGWATVFIDNISYNRVDASSATINSGFGREWKWTTSANPFTSGTSYNVVFSDDGQLPLPYALPVVGEEISMSNLAEFFGVSTSTPVTLNDTVIRDYLNRASGSNASLSDYYHDGYFWRNGNDATDAICAKHQGVSIGSGAQSAYAGIDIKFTRRGPGMYTIEMKGRGYSNGTDTRLYYNKGGKSYSLSTTNYETAFDFSFPDYSGLTYLAMDWITDAQILLNYGPGSMDSLNNNDVTFPTISNNNFYSCSVGQSIGRTLRSYTSASAIGTSGGKHARWWVRFKVGGYGGTSAQTIALLKVETFAYAEYIDNIN